MNMLGKYIFTEFKIIDLFIWTDLLSNTVGFISKHDMTRTGLDDNAGRFFCQQQTQILNTFIPSRVINLVLQLVWYSVLPGVTVKWVCPDVYVPLMHCRARSHLCCGAAGPWTYLYFEFTECIMYGCMKHHVTFLQTSIEKSLFILLRSLISWPAPTALQPTLRHQAPHCKM